MAGYEEFAALHARDALFIMPNAWDGASAALLKAAGFAALGSSSAAIAWGLGRQDGTRAVSRAEAIANAALLGDACGLPVHGDLEDGFGDAPEDCAACVEAAIAAGLAGLGIEDTTADPARPIHDEDAAIARVAAAARAARGRIVLTGRTDLLLHGSDDLDAVVRRLTAFADTGADVLYAPGLTTIAAVETVVRAVAPLPVNVLATPDLSLAALSAAGVRRVSLGATLYRTAMAGLLGAAEALTRDDMAAATRGVPGARIAQLLER